VAIETLVVYNVANYDAVTEFFQGHQQARQRRAEMYRQARKAAGLGEPLHLQVMGRRTTHNFSCRVYSLGTYVMTLEYMD
jgi:hypothetical protein